jgi:3-oxoacyl-[acyl-carrier protein] reductase
MVELAERAGVVGRSLVDLELGGRVVLVTGAGQGLGREIGMAFAREGAHVAFHYHSSQAGAEEAAAEAGRLTGMAMAVRADVRLDDDVRLAVDAVESQLGPISVLVNNAAATGAKRFLDTTSDDWTFQVSVTVTGTLRVTHEVSRRMVARSLERLTPPLSGGHPPSPGQGVIVSLMGDSGRVGESGLTVTATARASTMALTKSLAKELARHGIRANCVSIGLVQTDRFDEHAGLSGAGAADEERMKKILAQYPLRRLGRPSDITPLVLLLGSPLSAWTTGQVISVNGGYSMA